MHEQPAWRLRKANPQDIDAIIQLLKEGFSGYWTSAQYIYNREFLEWLYRANPGGGAITLVAESGGEIIGHLSSILERFRVQGSLSSVGVAVHLAIHPNSRRKGIFKSLGEQMQEELKQSNAAFSLAVFPNDKSRPGFLNKLNFSAIADVPLLVKPLQIKNILARITNKPSLAAAFSFFLRPAYQAVSQQCRIKKDDNHFKIIPISSFGAEFDLFWKQANAQAKVIQERDARFLHWRFNQRPKQNYSVAAAFKDEELVGYIATRKADIFSLKAGIIMDYLVLPQAQAAFHPLLEYALTSFKKDGVDFCLSACLKNNIYYRKFKQGGFLAIPAKLNPRKFILTGKINTKTPDSKMFMDKKNWFFTFADWDVF